MDHAMEHETRDMNWICERLYQVGGDGINFDTIGAAGDADFLATLRTIEYLRKKFPNIVIEAGMAGEFVLGMYGTLEYDGQRLAGMYPHQQVKMVEKAGGTIFGPVCNTNIRKSFPWNLARACTYIKACVEASNIPIHVNVGMGVGGIPVYETPPVDCVTRCSKAMAEVAKVDGL